LAFKLGFYAAVINMHLPRNSAGKSGAASKSASIDRDGAQVDE
jgi:hypothetical protein